jgi:hypothetical protein
MLNVCGNSFDGIGWLVLRKSDFYIFNLQNEGVKGCFLTSFKVYEFLFQQYDYNFIIFNSHDDKSGEKTIKKCLGNDDSGGYFRSTFSCIKNMDQKLSKKGSKTCQKNDEILFLKIIKFNDWKIVKKWSKSHQNLTCFRVTTRWQNCAKMQNTKNVKKCQNVHTSKMCNLCMSQKCAKSVLAAI